MDKIKKFLTQVYAQLVTMNDSPHSIALGFGVGVFLGIMPGTGPFAALAVAFIFRLNKAAALLGGFLTNTWLSVITFILSVKIGCAFLGIKFDSIAAQAHDLMVHFSFKTLFSASVFSILKPLLIGYAIVGFFCGLLSYGLVLLALLAKKDRG